MSKKNTILSVMALVLAVVALAISLVSCLRPVETGTDHTAEIESLWEKNALLQSQIDALSAQISNGSTLTTGLTHWDLALVSWSNGGGASVTLTAVPANHEDGMTASFYVRKGSVEVVTVPCSWTGEAFTATAELTAQDGYSYYCILENEDGSRQQLALTTPENPVEDVPVYLETALRAYCNLTLDSWLDLDGTLTVSCAYVQAQLPRLTQTGEAATIEKTELVLYYGGKPYSSQTLTLEDSIGDGAYTLTVTDARLAMPQMGDDEALELWLEMTLSDGQVLTALGGSWYLSGGELFVVVG